MELKKLPESLIVIGGRAIALELGQMFSRFGVKITILQRSPRLIPDHEPEISKALMEYLKEEGLDINTEVEFIKIKKEDSQKAVYAKVRGKEKIFRGDEVLVAVGITPNTEDLGLEEIGVELDENGFIKINEYLQTSNPLIYAAGDVTTLPKLVYVAAKAGGIAAENIANGNSKKLDISILPDVVFTDPQVARVGITEEEAKCLNFPVKTSILPLSYVPHAVTSRDTRGLIKLIVNEKEGTLLGAHIVSSLASEMIQTAALAVKLGKTHNFKVNDLEEMFFPYLTQSEGLKLAIQTLKKPVSQLSCCAG